MRLAPVRGKRGERRSDGQACSLDEGERGKCVHRVVAAGNEKRLFRAEERRLRRALIKPGKPQQAVSPSGEAVFARLDGLTAAERAHGTSLCKTERLGVLAIDDANGVLLEDAPLRLGVGLHVAVPIKVVLGDVQNSCGCALEARRRVELKARELKHPDLGQNACIERLVELGHGVGADVARSRRTTAALGGHLRDQRRRGRLAVRAGHADYDGAVTRAGLKVCERSGEEFDLAHDLNVAGPGARDKRCSRTEAGGKPGGHHDERNAVEERFGQAARADFRIGHLGPESLRTGGRLARVGRADFPSAATETMRAVFLSTSCFMIKLSFSNPAERPTRQRILSVERPMSTRIIVMIQKRVTTWVSFQPLSSK